MRGESIALVSDAGTPLVSDPGIELVRAARSAGVRVEAIPGPSAVLTLLASAGFTDRAFSFVGFVPTRSKDRAEWLAKVRNSRETVVFFEAPHRIDATIGEMTKLLPPSRLVAVGRELTKAHEEVVVCPIGEVLGRLHSFKGEFTIAVSPLTESEDGSAEAPTEDELRREVGLQTESGAASKRDAVKRVARKYGLAPNDVYKLLDRDD
jgi:16S rRNA (cytidine1402-2'-O)-methyltransferase